jgi:hypothetical protein
MAWMIYMAIPEDQAVLAAIGKIALRHGQLDHVLRMTIKSLTGVSANEAIDATARQGSRELRERIRKLARRRLGEGVALVQLEAMLERCRRATEKRNELLHSLWGHQLDGGHVMRTHGYELVAIPSVQELEAVAEALFQVAKDLDTARWDGFLSEALAIRTLPTGSADDAR